MEMEIQRLTARSTQAACKLCQHLVNPDSESARTFHHTGGLDRLRGKRIRRSFLQFLHC